MRRPSLLHAGLDNPVANLSCAASGTKTLRDSSWHSHVPCRPGQLSAHQGVPCMRLAWHLAAWCH